MPGDAISFVVDDPDTFFSSSRANSTNSTISNSHPTNESLNPMQRSSVSNENDRAHSTLSDIELTNAGGRLSGTTEGNESNPAPAPVAPTSSRATDLFIAENGDVRHSSSDSNQVMFPCRPIQVNFFIIVSLSLSQFDRPNMPSIDQIQISMIPNQSSLSQAKTVVAHSIPQGSSPYNSGAGSSPTLMMTPPKNKISVNSLRPSKIGSALAENFERIKQRITSPRNSFVFTDYSPKRFAHIRALSGISTESYLQSFQSTTMPEFSEGKSGAFLYFSSDYKYIVKTTTAREFEKLLQILPDYEKYFEKQHKKHRNPLLTRYLGAHRIVMYDIPLYFVVMKNVCPSVDEKYDLKGSWVNRHGSKLNKDPRSARPKKNYNVIRQSLMSQSQSFGGPPSGVAYMESTKGVDGDSQKDGAEGGTMVKKIKEKTPLFLDNDLQNSFIIHPDDARQLAKQIHRDIRFLEGKYNFVS
jgi:hypothetical protein